MRNRPNTSSYELIQLKEKLTQNTQIIFGLEQSSSMMREENQKLSEAYTQNLRELEQYRSKHDRLSVDLLTTKAQHEETKKMAQMSGTFKLDLDSYQKLLSEKEIEVKVL